MLISVFVPTGNRGASLARMLHSLSLQTYTSFEVIVVDYKSTDNTKDVIQKYQKKLSIHLIQQKEKGLAKAANLALKQARGTVFIRTDDDVVVSPRWLEAIASTFKSDSKIGGVTGPTIIPQSYRMHRDLFVFEEKFTKGTLLWRLLGRIYYGYFMQGTPYAVSVWFKSGAFGLGSNFPASKKEPLHDITNLEACNFSVRTNLLKKVGGFDESFGGVGEYHEADAAFKIRHLGYRLVFNPHAWLNHLPSQDGFYSDRPASYSRMVNFMVFYLRHIRVDTLDKLCRFGAYVLFLNVYYIRCAVAGRQVTQLGAIPGTIVGILKHISHS